jgi:Dolichyl-phosphate-mannose-protein mannosyltransferase
MTERLRPLPVPVRLRSANSGWRLRLLRTTAACSFLVLILLFQWLGGAYSTEFAGYPDEGAHYITGLMLRDYLARHQLTSFRQFAENYYLHYPKVALGHWPPFFYAVQAVWTLVFPTSRASLLLLMATITALMVFTLFRTVEDEFGTVLGIMAALLLAALPVIQAYSGMVMADTLTGLLSFWAVLCFARFMDRPDWQYAAWFGLLSALSILTKGTGFALVLVPPLTLLFTGRWKLMRRAVFWVPAVIMLPLCVPWYWLTRHMLPSTWQQPEPGLHYIRRALHFYSLHSLRILGGVLIGLAVIGFVVEVLMRRREDVKSKWAAFAALLFSTGFLALAVPAGLEERFLIPALPAALAFAIAGLDFLAGRLLPGKLSLPWRRAALILPVTALFLADTFFIPKNVSFGFAPVAEYVLSQPKLAKAVLLISSDAIGESMFISELAVREARPGHYVLRASKVLCNCSWSGDQQSSLYPTPEALMEYFTHSPIQIVIDDKTVRARSHLEYRQVLETAIQAYPQRWTLLGTYPLTRDGILYPKGANVYRVSGTDPSAPVEIDLRRMLNKTMQLQPGH